jgi:hypothetical protein
LVQHTDKGDCNSKRAVTDIKDATAMAETFGIKVSNFYWSGAHNAVLVLQAADKNGITTWQDSLQNLRVELIPTAPSSDPVTPLTTTGGWGLSSDMVQWWY